MKVVTISSWLNFSHLAPPGRGSEAGRNFWLRLTTASAQCLRLSERFFSFSTFLFYPKAKKKFGSIARCKCTRCLCTFYINSYSFLHVLILNWNILFYLLNNKNSIERSHLMKYLRRESATAVRSAEWIYLTSSYLPSAPSRKVRLLTMQDLENDGPNRRAGKCRTLKVIDRKPMHKKLQRSTHLTFWGCFNSH